MGGLIIRVVSESFGDVWALKACQILLGRIAMESTGSQRMPSKRKVEGLPLEYRTTEQPYGIFGRLTYKGFGALTKIST